MRELVDTLQIAGKYVIKLFETRFFSHIMEIEKASFKNPYTSKILRLLASWYPELFLTALKGNLLVGYVVAAANEDRGHIISLAVRPDCRRQRIGTDLLASLMERLKSLEVMTVSLEVRADNLAAIALYEKLGFVRSGNVRHYYEDGCAAIMFEKSLS
jgi:[ribosomal protein S18]-alanine N-acetyltransferase